MTDIPLEPFNEIGITAYSDAPLGSGGNNADEFSRNIFAERVASLLLQRTDQEGIIVSIEGEWGSGKTSVLAMIQSHLAVDCGNLSTRKSIWRRLLRKIKLCSRNLKVSPETNQRKQPFLIEFNPWMVGEADHMVQTLMAQIASEISHASHAEDAVDAAQKLIAYAQLLQPIKWIPGAGPWAILTSQVLETTGKGVKAVGKLHDLSINRRRASLKAALNRLGKQIIIFIDDIDRLPPGEVYQAIRAIQAVADLPFCSFVMALDPRHVESALQSAGSFQAPSKYLDKIIQLRLTLPVINQTELEAYFTSKLWGALSPRERELYENESDRLIEVWRSGLKTLLQTPRDALRIINRFLYALPASGEEVCWGDLMGLQALAILFPSIYEHIRSNPGAYTGMDLDGEIAGPSGQKYVDLFAEQRDKILNNLDEIPGKELTHNAVRRLLGQLFPLTSNTTYNKLDQRSHSMQRRVASSNRLRIALTYGLPSDEISQQNLVSFLEQPATRVAILNDLRTRNLLARMLERIQEEIPSALIPDPVDLITLFGKLIEEPGLMECSDGSARSLHRNNLSQLVNISNQILAENCHESEQISALEAIVSNASILSLSSHLIRGRYLQNIQPQDQGDNKDPSEESVPENASSVLQKWLFAASSRFQDGSFCSVQDKNNVIMALRGFKAGKAQLPALLKPFLSAEEKMDSVAEILISNTRHSTSEGMSIGCSPGHLADLGNIFEIRRMAKLRVEQMSEEENPRLLAIYKSVIHEDFYRVSDSQASRENPLLGPLSDH